MRALGREVEDWLEGWEVWIGGRLEIELELGIWKRRFCGMGFCGMGWEDVLYEWGKGV